MTVLAAANSTTSPAVNLNSHLVVTATGGGTDGTVIITGTDENDAVIVETVAAFAAAGSEITNHKFKAVTSVVNSATDADASINIGTTDVTLVDKTRDLKGSFLTITEDDSTAANANDARFRIEGTDLAGNFRTEIMQGPGADGTVTSTIAYATITKNQPNG